MILSSMLTEDSVSTHIVTMATTRVCMVTMGTTIAHMVTMETTSAHMVTMEATTTHMVTMETTSAHLITIYTTLLTWSPWWPPVLIRSPWIQRYSHSRCNGRQDPWLSRPSTQGFRWGQYSWKAHLSNVLEHCKQCFENVMCHVYCSHLSWGTGLKVFQVVHL